VASYRFLEKAGFIREKVVKGNWKWHDQVFDSAYYFLQKPADTIRDCLPDQSRPDQANRYESPSITSSGDSIP
jgi:hypothetical protein